MAAPIYDVIVVGAGVEGSFTAYHLAKQGKRTLLLEQFPLPHTRGSSHGQSRIIRKAYGEKHFANMMVEAYPLWAQLEKETNTSLYKRTGMVMIGQEGGKEIAQTGAALAAVGCKHEHLSPSQFKARFPMMTFPSNFGAVLDHEAGILHADRCVAKIQEMYQRFGGELHDGEKVVTIRPGDVVSVETTRGQYRAKSLVLAAGAWAAQMTKELGLNLPLQPLCITVSYWKQKGDQTTHSKDSMPTFIAPKMAYRGPSGLDSVEIYGIPANEYPNHVKICLHEGAPISDPEARDAMVMGVWKQGALAKFVQNHFPGLEDKPSITERCMYTMTPDENFFLDTHPKWKNIVIGAGFSGHGFKLAPVVGKILAELAQRKTSTYDLSHFKMNRFSQNAKL